METLARTTTELAADRPGLRRGVPCWCTQGVTQLYQSTTATLKLHRQQVQRDRTPLPNHVLTWGGGAGSPD